MTPCGQTIAHLPHWMHTAESHTGISSAMFRFSQRAVAIGNVPSHGSMLTGSESPCPAMILPSTLRTNSGAWAGTGGGSSIWLVRSEEHTSELQSHSFISYAVFCLK